MLIYCANIVVGYGVYLGPSVFDHSCDANATQYFDRTTLIIRANQNVNTLYDVSENLTRKYFLLFI